MNRRTLSEVPGTGPRVLIVPGLRNSGPAHWQTWLQARTPGAIRVEQHVWHQPELERWSARITNVLERQGDHEWIAVAHSFGCLALAHHLDHHPHSPVRAALLVAPAEPDKFGLGELLPQTPLGIPATLVLSETDPWMTAFSARKWARRWGASQINLGRAGHINSESGHGPWPLAEHWLQDTQTHLQRRRLSAVHTEAERRIA